MTSSESGGIRQCLSEMIKAEATSDYQKALQAANKMIRRHPKELLGYKGKLTALIQLALYEDALTFIGQCSTAQLGKSTFEHGYVLYRLGQNVEALEVLKDAGSDDYKINELKAQIYYKLEKYQEAHDMFLWLIKNHSDEYDEERKANFLAVQAQLESVGSKQQIDSDLGTFEQLYNAACQKIEAKKWTAALELLGKAIELCRSTLVEEGLTEEELEQELALIRIQRAFVLHKMSRRQEALEEYQKVQAAGSNDVSVRATLLNNLPGAAGDENVAETKKKLKSALAVDQTKLTPRQRKTLMQNNVLVLLLSNQREPCRRALEELTAKYGSTKDTKLIHAALLVKMNDINKALEVLSDDQDPEVIATRLHIAVNHGLFSQVIQSTKELPADLRGSPAVISLTIASLMALGETDKAVAEIENNLKTTKTPEDTAELLTIASQLETKKAYPQGAAKFLEKLLELQPKNDTVKCRLIGIYAQYDAQKAKSLTDKVFPAISSSGIDVDELEESDWILRGEKYKQRKEGKMDTEDAEIITRKLKNSNPRKRKIRLPKNYDPNVAPDPERWLPRQERAAYKKKFKKNRDRDIGRGTQGSASANPNVEFTAASPASPRAVPLAAEGPRQQRPTKAQKQKNKKKTNKF